MAHRTIQNWNWIEIGKFLIFTSAFIVIRLAIKTQFWFFWGCNIYRNATFKILKPCFFSFFIQSVLIIELTFYNLSSKTLQKQIKQLLWKKIVTFYCQILKSIYFLFRLNCDLIWRELSWEPHLQFHFISFTLNRIYVEQRTH
jgi:hypothetical protein